MRKLIEPINADFDSVAKALITPKEYISIEGLKHILYNGDCLEKLKLLDANSIHLIITDPPYFLDGLDNSWNDDKIKIRKSKAGVVGGLPTGMKFDPKKGIEFQIFYTKVSKELIRVLKPGGFFLSFSQPRLTHRMAIAMEDAGFEIRDLYAWYYTNQAQMKAFSQNHFVDKMNISEKEKDSIKAKLNNRKTAQLRPQFESIVMAQKPKEGTYIDNWLKWETGLVDTAVSTNGITTSTIMQVEKPRKADKGDFNEHLTVKPTDLIEHLIKIFSKENQTVLDPFLGSGTTAIAAQNTKRICIGIEIELKYLEFCKQRLNRIRGNYEYE